MPDINNDFPIEWARNQFPGLKGDMVFMDNAGGSQALAAVMSRITEYLTLYNVQLGASYATSSEAAKQLELVKLDLLQWLNANDCREIINGASTTQLLRILSLCISQLWSAGDEVVITNCDHAANVECWKSLQKNGIKIRTWSVNPNTLRLELDDLKALLSDKTRLVAVTHVSNVLGTINDIQTIAQLVHQYDALVCVDGVAYASHRMLDMQQWGVDFYVFSTYKTYGPHQAIMYGKLALLEKIPGINHAFINAIPYKFQPGNFNYELTYSLSAITSYLTKLGNIPGQNNMRSLLANAFKRITEYEQLISQPLLTYLNDHPEVKVIGETGDCNNRVPTISFVHQELTSQAIVDVVDEYNIGIRFGDFYAGDLIDDLGLREKGGVVRVSLLHYNTLVEVNNLIKVFKQIL